MGNIMPIPIGVEFYKDMISEGYYYVDKTLLIYDILTKKSKVTLFAHPSSLDMIWHIKAWLMK